MYTTNKNSSSSCFNTKQNKFSSKHSTHKCWWVLLFLMDLFPAATSDTVIGVAKS